MKSVLSDKFVSPVSGAIKMAKKKAEMETYNFGKGYRFFYHFRKETGGMTVHFKNKCYPVQDVKCMVPCETKWNKDQPRLVMRGFASEVIVKDGVALIQ